MNNMSPKVVLTGGGSGGHIMPILSVAAALKRRDPKLQLIYVGKKGDSFADIPAHDSHIDKVFAVRAGKLRRFHNGRMKQLLDIATMAQNIRDGFYVIIGVYQSWRLMTRIKPALVFSRGGFVSVPVAIGAKLQHIPYITHDSDLIPSLANRLIAPWARYHAVAFDAGDYPYPPDKTVTTGIPVNTNFKPVTENLRKKYRQQIGIPPQAKMLFIIGGSLGSQDVNAVVADSVAQLINEFHDLYVVHVAGRGNEMALGATYDTSVTDRHLRQRIMIHDYINDVYLYSGAADLVICRAGATNLAEFSIQGKACIVLPSSFLAAGHQLKNAEYLKGKGAAIILTAEELTKDSKRLMRHIEHLLQHPEECNKLGRNFACLAQPDAADQIAQLILGQL